MAAEEAYRPLKTLNRACDSGAITYFDVHASERRAANLLNKDSSRIWLNNLLTLNEAKHSANWSSAARSGPFFTGEIIEEPR